MRKRAWLMILALAGVPGSMPAQEKVALRFAPAEGTGLTYSLSSVINVDGKNFMGKDLALNADSRGEIRLLAKPSTHETVRADLTSAGIDVNIRLPDRVLSQKLGTTEGEALEVVFNRTGKVESIRNPEAVGAGNPFNISISQILRDYFPAFPAEPVGRGDSWSESRRLTIPFQGLDLQVNLAINYTLDDILPADDGRTALVSAVYRVTVSGAKDLGDAQGVFEGEGAGAGSLQVCVDKGWFSEYRVDFKTDAAFVMKKGTDRLAEFPFSFSAFAEVLLISVQPPDRR
ncbi:MAG: hypothetical protein A2V76_08325 [Candidatus Aminicenantes bacterium RBG_16_63_14]|nr:MAG: hypothetical protein A2V76_08325 [Candidatus Aminicenantes bacterium RBG_16_63_14]